jgi:glutaminase
VEHTFALNEFELIEGFTDEELAYLASAMTVRCYASGEAIIETGGEARELFLLACGRVSVFVGRVGSLRRLATFSAGMVFGEMSLIDRSPRSATIIADSPVECRVLLIDAFDRLGEEHPAVKIKLLENLGRGLSRKLRKANEELSVFE